MTPPLYRIGDGADGGSSGCDIVADGAGCTAAGATDGGVKNGTGAAAAAGAGGVAGAINGAVPGAEIMPGIDRDGAMGGEGAAPLATMMRRAMRGRGPSLL
jgi:hypothetical protein